MLQQSTRSDRPHHLPQQIFLVNALESIANAIFITDQTGHIVWMNQAFSRLCGYAPEELFGNTPAMLNSDMQSKPFYVDLWQTILSGKVWRGIIIDRRKDGTLYTVDETITPLLNEHGSITHFIAIQQDMTLQSQQQEQERYLAYHDMLTGLPNRGHFIKLLEQEMLHAARAKEMFAVLFLDLDKFKPVNDTFGHDVGDRLLQAVAERLQSAIRKSDTVARFGGDEFAILLVGLLDMEVAITIACKLVSTLAQPFVIGEHKIHIGVSIGIAMYPADGKTQEELTRKADQAMYAAKQQGGNSYRFYSNTFS